MLAAEFCVDSSVLVAIFNEGSDAERLEDICWNFNWAIGWPTIFETRLWLIRNRPPGSGRLLDAMIDQASITQIEFGGGLEGLAAEAFDRFGKGRHPAKLNFGDCMAYACAKSLNLPLLFKGGDFGKTDIAIHPASVIIE